MMHKRKNTHLVLALMLFILAHAGAVFAGDIKKKDATQPADLPAFLNDLGEKVSNFKTLKTDFTQEKEMALFKEKLILKGRIYIKKPHMLAWHVDHPLRYSVLITDTLIRQWDENANRVQEISLANNPIFQNVLKQLTVWFSGEYGSLLEENTMRLVKRDPLVIEFTPRDTNLSKNVIKDITVTFRDDRTYLQQIRIRELNGDVTTIYFTNTLMNVPLDSRSFEVQPVKKRTSRMYLDNDSVKPAFEQVVCCRCESTVFCSHGVNPVRERNTHVSPHDLFMRLSRKDVVDGYREPAAFSNGVTGYV
jgi:outer membrane lipoprotein-sorting protein